MLVSVVVCTYSEERYDIFSECVESILGQTYEPIELVIIVDGNDTVFERVTRDFGDVDDLVANLIIYNNDQNRGISYSRTKGAELGGGEIVAFIDDDGVAEPDWIEEHIAMYEATSAIAVAGEVAPDWIHGAPKFFPEEFYWLVGCTEPGFAEHGAEIRNGYGSNVSYQREKFLEIGGYDANTGRKGDRHIQAHEAPAGIRLQRHFGKGVIYTADSVVNHRLFHYRGRFKWLVFRSFWQGFSKRVMEVLYPGAQGNERQYLKDIFFDRVPTRIGALFRSPSGAQIQQLITIFVFTGAVGLGYLYGLTRGKNTLLREVD